MKIFIGNLADEVTEEDLQEAFAAFGTIRGVSIARDKYSGMSRGFAFVEMPRKSEAKAAMREMDLKEIKGRAIVVNEAKPKSGSSGGRGKRKGRRR